MNVLSGHIPQPWSNTHKSLALSKGRPHKVQRGVQQAVHRSAKIVVLVRLNTLNPDDKRIGLKEYCDRVKNEQSASIRLALATMWD